jgi:diguanylate cyclase (GGDEF)-like protein
MPAMPDQDPIDRSAALSFRDYFLHPSFFQDPDKLHRARILVATLYAIILLTVVATLFLVVVPVPMTSRLLGIPIETTVTIAAVTLLFRLKNHASYNLCSRVTTGVMFTAIAFATMITGGVTESPVAPLLVIPPLMAFFFGGIRAGNGVTLLVGLLIAVAMALAYSGVQMPQFAPADQKGLIQSLVLLIGFSALAALAFVYEYTSALLRKERDKEHQKVVQLAQTDSLTGLVNRRVFDEMLAERIARYQASAQPRPFALCYLDLDGFKPINDRHGHDVGDQVLRTVSIRLRSALRGADLIGRQGGDEFMLLLDQLEEGPALAAMANRFLKIIADPIETSAGLLSVGASLGFAFFPAHGGDTEILKKSADNAMYDAKRNHLGWRVSGSPQPSNTGD